MSQQPTTEEIHEQAESQKPKEEVKWSKYPNLTNEEFARYEELKKRMIARLNQLNFGIDP